MQLLSAVQVVDRHAELEAQVTLPGQAPAVAAGQLPLPSHFASGVSEEPLQATVPQLVVVVATRHFPPPHMPSSPQVVVPAVHSFAGSVPSFTLPHVPSAASPVSFARHETHVPLQAVLQHTLSTQKPERHSAPAEQAWPGVCCAVQVLLAVSQ